MASDVQLCNMALTHIGASARVASINPADGTVEAGYCATFFGHARTEMIELGDWGFTLARESLAEVTNPSVNWAYAYALPSLCLRARRLPTELGSLTVFTQDSPYYSPDDDNTAPFTVEGTVLYTNLPEAVLIYTKDVTDTTKWTPSFSTAFSMLLASYLAGPIVKGNDGARLGDALRARAIAMAATSATAAANAGNDLSDFQPSSVQARR